MSAAVGYDVSLEQDLDSDGRVEARVESPRPPSSSALPIMKVPGSTTMKDLRILSPSPSGPRRGCGRQESALPQHSGDRQRQATVPGS